MKATASGLARGLAAALLAAALALLPCLAGAQAAPAELAELLERARGLTAAGKAEEAYRALAAREDEYIGLVDFDYALGRAALESGRPDRATLAFTRVLAVDPKHAGASIDMGRAYLALGNREQARAIFGGLLALDPPAAVRAQLAAYLAQSGGAAERRTFAGGFVSATAGHDSNVNAAAAQARVFVPLFGTEVDLAGANVRKSDGYAGLSAGLDVTHQIDDRTLLIGGVEAADRSNAHHSEFDLSAMAARVGAARVWDRYFARAQLLSARSYLGGKNNRDVRALALDASQVPGEAMQWSGYAQAGTIRYLPPELRIFDADFVTAGVGARRAWETGTAVYFSASAGRDNDAGGNPAGDRRALGLLVGLEMPLRGQLWLQASIGVQDSKYELSDPAFQVRRHDRREDFDLGLQYLFSPDLRLRLGVRATRQGSNIAIYDYPRQDIGITLRRDFR